MSPIQANLQHVQARIGAAIFALPVTQRRPVCLVAVSKTQPAEAIRTAYTAGQRCFGENYVQEALDKIEKLCDLDIEWHFIGPIQSNKAKSIARHFAWVHGLDRVKIADALARARPEGIPPLNVCIQVNVSGEASKCGIAPDDALPLARYTLGLPRLRLRGLMTIIENNPDISIQRQQFGLLRHLAEQMEAHGISLDTLSMGMSGDFETAISEGANMIRIGAAIFGERA